MAKRSRKSRSRRSFGGRSFNGFIDGGMGGAAASIGARVLGPDYGPAVGLGAVGMWRRNDTLQTMAGVDIGAKLASRVNVPGFSGAAPGGLL